MELKVMKEMIERKCLPACKQAGVSSVINGMVQGVQNLQKDLHKMEEASSAYEKARVARVARLETMEAVRKVCDEAEMLVPPEMWPIASYESLMFLDYMQGSSVPDKSKGVAFNINAAGAGALRSTADDVGLF